MESHAGSERRVHALHLAVDAAQVTPWQTVVVRLQRCTERIAVARGIMQHNQTVVCERQESRRLRQGTVNSFSERTYATRFSSVFLIPRR
jgi:hypothetical protein